jgi:hypothetical protein
MICQYPQLRIYRTSSTKLPLLVQKAKKKESTSTQTKQGTNEPNEEILNLIEPNLQKRRVFERKIP